MNIKDKKILAEWFGLEVLPKNLWHDKNLMTLKRDFWDKAKSGYWQPESNSNQLNMLEDKFMEEIDCHAMIYNVEEMRAEYDYWLEDEPLAYVGKGKTKNEARLNAILVPFEML
ncbi:MAG: hypothetical protein JETCAE03_34720 [Ignavibacteriaceae bacterium]|jgi:hypothetical protein|nr:MAG: hypothetical protein JETCAE03_34720 [Ignavibacteriaceae bacterium]